MTSYAVKALFILLVYVLLFRHYWGWAKNSTRKLKPVLTGIIAVAAGTAAVFLLTLFEVLICLAVVCVVYIFRKQILTLYREILSGKYGKLKSVVFTVAVVFSSWLWLALFYRTDFGMPIGVQNYLFHKYNEEFEVSGFFGATIAGHPTNQLTCFPKNGNPQTDAFNVVRKNTLSIGSRRFASDNYYGIIIRDEYEKYISDIVSKYFDEFKVFVRFNFSGLSNTKYMSDEFDKNTSLADFFNYQKNSDNIRACNRASIVVFFNEQPTIRDKDNIIKKIQLFCSDLQNELNYVSVFFAVFDEESKYNYDSLTVDTYYAWSNPNNWDYSPRCIYFGLDHKSEIMYFEIDEQFFISREE